MFIRSYMLLFAGFGACAAIWHVFQVYTRNSLDSPSLASLCDFAWHDFYQTSCGKRIPMLSYRI